MKAAGDPKIVVPDAAKPHGPEPSETKPVDEHVPVDAPHDADGQPDLPEPAGAPDGPAEPVEDVVPQPSALDEPVSEPQALSPSREPLSAEEGVDMEDTILWPGDSPWMKPPATLR